MTDNHFGWSFKVIFCYRYMLHCFLLFILQFDNIGQINILLKLLLQSCLSAASETCKT